MARWNDLEQLFGAMDLFRNRMNSVFGDLERPPVFPGQVWAGAETCPRTNLWDTGDNLEVIAELPGVARADVNVKIQGNYLEISGTRKRDVPEGYSVHRTERNAASFSRSFTLPYEVDAAQVQATLRDGLLRMRLPKSEAAKPRQITIS